MTTDIRQILSAHTPEAIQWYRWINTVCALAGIDDLDGNWDRDGYSIYSAHDAFCSGASPREFVARTF